MALCLNILGINKYAQKKVTLVVVEPMPLSQTSINDLATMTLYSSEKRGEADRHICSFVQRHVHLVKRHVHLLVKILSGELLYSLCSAV